MFTTTQNVQARSGAAGRGRTLCELLSLYLLRGCVWERNCLSDRLWTSSAIYLASPLETTDVECKRDKGVKRTFGDKVWRQCWCAVSRVAVMIKSALDIFVYAFIRWGSTFSSSDICILFVFFHFCVCCVLETSSTRPPRGSPAVFSHYIIWTFSAVLTRGLIEESLEKFQTGMSESSLR